LFVMLAGSNLPTPLYAVYQQRFGFSSGALTLVFATYALVLIPALMVFGELSDRIGRRRVIAGGLVSAAVGLAIFATAQGIAWLYVARVFQGLAVGATSGTATAALVELDPDGDHSRAAIVAVAAQAGGAAAGPVLAGLLAQWAPWPRQLCYLVGLVANLAVGVAVLRIREPHPRRGRWHLQRPRVPAGEGAAFARAGLTAAAVWAVGALYVSIVPSYVGKLLRTHDLALIGAISATMLATACAVQLVSLRTRVGPRTAQPLGLALLVLGLVALVAAFPVHSLPMLIVAALLAGAGLGFGFFGSQTRVNQLAPSDRRGEVTAAFITCVYAGVATAAISAGLISDVASLFLAVTIVGSVIGVLALATAAWHLSTDG
jgi:MFS family permease